MTRFALAMVWREARHTWRRQLFLAFCIALGVGGLVAVRAFSLGVEARMEREARTLLAADLVMRSARPFTAAEQAALDDLVADGAALSTSLEFVSMAQPESGETTRLVSVRTVEPNYPFYGEVLTGSGRPFRELLRDDTVLVHPAVLLHLGLEVGQRIVIGERAFTITGELLREPDHMQVFGYAPRVLMTAGGGEATGLIQEKSLIRHRAMVRLPEGAEPAAVAEALKERLPDRFASIRTYDKAQPNVSRFLGHLSRYLNLIGLVALILGGVGVAAAIRVFLSQKLDTIAILKCLGTTSRGILAIYALQAVALGLLGSALGVALGLGVQGALPALLADMLPVRLDFVVPWPAVLQGLGLGLLTTLLFTLAPILEVRAVPPARVFRRHVEPPARRRFDLAWNLGLVLPLLGALSLWAAGDLKVGGIFFVGLLGAVVALFLGARGLLALMRRLPKRGGFALRQGLSGLYRPGNQAVPVTMALGLGVLMVLTVFLLQSDLLNQVSAGRTGEEPNLIFFDIQRDQRDTFKEILAAHGLGDESLIPIVRARLSALNGQPLRLDEIEDEDRRRVLGFTYALTYREKLLEGEEVLAGTWGPDPDIAGHQVSVADWWIEYSQLGIGDTVTVDIQGVPVTATVTSVRQVDWSNRRANFSLVYMPGALEQAPHMYVAPVQVPDPEARVALQKDVVARLPNVSAADVELVLETLQTLVERIALVIQFMAAFSIAVGLVILGGAIATTKYQRLHEAVLLKTLGATRAAVAGVLATEYALLGTLAGLVGAVAAGALAWGLVTFVFDGLWSWRPAPYLTALAVSALLTTGIGLVSNLDILNRKPLPVLREE